MKKNRVFILIALIVIAGTLVLGYQVSKRASAASNLETAPVQRGVLQQYVSADGTIRSRQSASLVWKTSGTISDVAVKVGDQVQAGQTLAVLSEGSLSPNVLLARADLIDAQRALDDLQQSHRQQAQAQQALEQARKDLEDAQDPGSLQAAAQTELAAAQKAVEDAQLQYELIAKPPSAGAIQQTHSNLLLAENTLETTQENIDRINKKLKKPESAYMFFESREFYQNILDNLEQKRIYDQRSYDKALERYNHLVEPPDPIDVAVAQANLTFSQARQDQAQKEWERIKDGADPADLALLQAQLADAERKWDRLKEGPDPNDLKAAEARVTAAQATLNQIRITAPFSGTLTRVENKPGDQVNPGTPAFRLDDLTQTLVDVMVSEIDINQVQPGQAVTLTLESVPIELQNQALENSSQDGFRRIEYLGKVVEVQTVGQSAEGITQFPVTLEITNPDALIKPGMSAHAHILVNQLEDVLLLPNSAIRFKDGYRIAFLKSGERFLPVQITTGAASDSTTQLVTGDLREGDLIVLDPSSELLNANP